MARKLIAVNPILAEWLAPTLRLRSNVKLKHSSGSDALKEASIELKLSKQGE